MLNASFAIQAIEALPPEEKAKVLAYALKLQNKTAAPKKRSPKVTLLPEHSTDALVLQMVMRELNLIKIPSTQVRKTA